MPIVLTINLMRTDYHIIENWIPQASSVLDLGCGDGALLQSLHERRGVRGIGVEINPDNVVACVRRGVNVVQANVEQGLQGFADKSFDFAVLSQTLQAIHTTESTLREMARVAKELIITLPNFGFWKQRVQLMFGRMPVSKALPHQWFNTPNVRYCTIDDFDVLIAELSLSVNERRVLDDNYRAVSWCPNLLGAVAMYRLAQE